MLILISQKYYLPLENRSYLPTHKYQGNKLLRIHRNVIHNTRHLASSAWNCWLFYGLLSLALPPLISSRAPGIAQISALLPSIGPSRGICTACFFTQRLRRSHHFLVLGGAGFPMAPYRFPIHPNAERPRALGSRSDSVLALSQ